ncbi:CaiB/BaiF CoA transferase family protein [Paraburkholderia sp. HD33-4]|uniref:CaiB/BaiF CoA transferase family protein n=1 Tax=Paraburkholderia sp. HD33-4 TaxID=2883242 RepID=UPI001F2EAD50|nr:CoA transferase [Paraburkholderia sp. HD33-4]
MNPNTPKALPLKGVKVIELSHLIAGPHCCQMLADEGATVIKVEPPGGELTRHREPTRRCEEGEVTAYYASLNRNKQSIVLDLKNRDGLGVFIKLLETADVFVTNLRVSALARLGLHPEMLRERFPRLIIAVISGFGMNNAGEHAERAGLAMVAEAMAGATGLTRDHAGNPVWCGFALGDIMAGVSAHAGILLALRDQERLGEGHLLDIGLVECMLPTVSVALGRVQVENNHFSDFAGSNNFHGVPYGAFPAADGAVNIGCNHDQYWRRLCVAMNRPELGTDERYASYLDRIKRQGEVHAITEAFTRAHTRAEIIAKLSEADVPVAGILSMEEVVSDRYLHERGALIEVEDGYGGTFTLPSNVVWPGQQQPASGVPHLGQHRDQILSSELGMTTAQIEQFARQGAFGALTRAELEHTNVASRAQRDTAMTGGSLDGAAAELETRIAAG